MKMKMTDKLRRRLRRRLSVRKKIYGTAGRPRITVYKSNKYTYLQVIDDDARCTLVSASNKEKELASVKNTVEGMAALGQALGKRLVEKKIDTAVFDRNGYLYHGRVKALADSIRKAGIAL